jgi:hypothetical protein
MSYEKKVVAGLDRFVDLGCFAGPVSAGTQARPADEPLCNHFRPHNSTYNYTPNRTFDRAVHCTFDRAFCYTFPPTFDRTHIRTHDRTLTTHCLQSSMVRLVYDEAACVR